MPLFISSIIQPNIKVEAAQISISRWMDKQNVVYTYHRMLFILRRKWNSNTSYNLGEPGKHTKWNNPDREEHDFTYISVQFSSVIQLCPTLCNPMDCSTYICAYICLCYAKSLQLSPTLFDPMSCSPQSSSVHGILQARKLEWLTMPSFRESSWIRDWTRISYLSCISRQVLYHLHHLGSPRLSYLK